MAYRFFAFIFVVFMVFYSFNLKAQVFDIAMDSLMVQAGDDFYISVKSKNSADLTSLQLVFSWDAQLLTFNKTKNYHLQDLNATDFAVWPPNRLALSWTDPSGLCVAIDSNEVLFDLCFSAVGMSGTNTTIRVDTNSLAGNCFEGSLPVTDTGIIIIGGTSAIFAPAQTTSNIFQICPNPTSSSTVLICQSPNSGVAAILISDVLGRTVFEHTFDLTPGENRFEIPANALNNKGIYQVALHTKGEAQSLLLSVQ